MLLLEQIPPLVVVVVGDDNYDKSLLQTPADLFRLLGDTEGPLVGVPDLCCVQQGLTLGQRVIGSILLVFRTNCGYRTVS